ncbi:MAG: hypothetical protein ACF8OB_17000 [Phycisphaeraceae bacterium JB051]
MVLFFCVVPVNKIFLQYDELSYDALILVCSQGVVSIRVQIYFGVIMFFKLEKIVRSVLLACVLISPVRAVELECQITGRYKLDRIVLEDLGAHYAAGLTKTISAPQGAHLELIEAHATITRSEDDKGRYNQVALKFFADDQPIACVATRKVFGTYIERAEYIKSVGTSRDKPKGETDFAIVILVPDAAKSIHAKAFLDREKEGQAIEFPGSVTGLAPPFIELGQVSVLDVKFVDAVEREESVSYRPKLSVPIVWAPAHGKIMLVKFQIEFNPDIPAKYRSFIFHPHYFVLEYANGQHLRPVGAISRTGLIDDDFVMNKGLRKDQSWGDTTWKDELAFIVDKQDKNFKIKFWPQEAKR